MNAREAYDHLVEITSPILFKETEKALGIIDRLLTAADKLVVACRNVGFETIYWCDYPGVVERILEGRENEDQSEQ